MASNNFNMFETTKKGLCYTEQFKDALKYDDPDLIKVFLKRYNSFKVQDRIGRTPLHMAALYGSNKCILVMIDFGYAVNQKDNDSKTPLIYALKYENVKAMNVLLDNGATSLLKDLFYVEMSLRELANSFSDRVFVSAIIRGMIKEKVSIQDVYDILEETDHVTYHAAVCSGNKELVRLVDVESKSQNEDHDDSMTYGMLSAIIDKNVKMIMFMHELGVNPKSKADDNEHNFLTYAASQLIPDDQDYIEVIRALIQIGVDVNEKCNGLNAVQWIVKCGNLDALRLAFAHGANINVVDAKKNTLLHLAVYNRELDVLRFLIKLNLKWDVKNDDQQTAIDLAKELSKIEALEILRYSNVLAE